MSPKHLHPYVAKFAVRHNVPRQDTIDQMSSVVAAMIGRRLMYRDLPIFDGQVSVKEVIYEVLSVFCESRRVFRMDYF